MSLSSLSAEKNHQQISNHLSIFQNVTGAVGSICKEDKKTYGPENSWLLHTTDFPQKVAEQMVFPFLQTILDERISMILSWYLALAVLQIP